MVLYKVLPFVKDFTSALIFAPTYNKRPSQCFLLFGVAFGLIGIAGQNVPTYYFIYYFSPFFVWAQVLSLVFQVRMIPAINQFKENPMKIVMTICVIVCIIECLIRAFFDRRALAIALFFLMLIHFNQKHRITSFIWMGLCLALMAFTFQPSVGKERSPYLVLVSTMISCAFFWTMINRIKAKKLVFKISLFYLIISGACVFMSDYNGTRIVSWIVLITALPMAFLSDVGLLERLLALNIGIMSMYQLFSLTYEALFLTCLTMTMFCWLFMENWKQINLIDLEKIKVGKSTRQRNMVNGDDFIRALTFLTFSIVSFFGTGNIASLNSFDPRSIQTLMTTFSPFLMGGLLLLKVILPFFVVALFAFSVQHVTQMPQKALFLMLLVLSDIMGLRFFFLVTDQGSWLDIGTSLSHFVIVEGTVIFLQVLFQLASFSMKLSFSKSQHITTNESSFDVHAE